MGTVSSKWRNALVFFRILSCGELMVRFIKDRQSRWFEETGASWGQTCIQGLRWGAMIWLTMLIARQLSHHLRWSYFQNPEFYMALGWLAILMVVVSTTKAGIDSNEQNGRRLYRLQIVPALLFVAIGIIAGVLVGIHKASGYRGPWNWSWALGLFLPALMPMIFLLLPAVQVRKNRFKRALLVVLIVIVLIPLAVVYETYGYYPGSNMKLVGLSLIVVVSFALGFMDPRIWFVPAVLVINSAVPYWLRLFGGDWYLGIAFWAILPVSSLFICAAVATAIFIQLRQAKSGTGR
jgi:MFS family permease